MGEAATAHRHGVDERTLIDQSLNVFMADADPDKLTAMHVTWARGLKTGMYPHSNPPRRRCSSD